MQLTVRAHPERVAVCHDAEPSSFVSGEELTGLNSELRGVQERVRVLDLDPDCPVAAI
ncbi:hypothetical protein [Streptomyces mirabilis]